MLRISPVDPGTHHFVLRLEGRIGGPWVIELCEACEKIIAEGRPLKLDMAEVSYLEPAGIALLSSISARGVKLLACSPFVAEQLKVATSLG